MAALKGEGAAHRAETAQRDLQWAGVHCQQRQQRVRMEGAREVQGRWLDGLEVLIENDGTAVDGSRQGMKGVGAGRRTLEKGCWGRAQAEGGSRVRAAYGWWIVGAAERVRAVVAAAYDGVGDGHEGSHFGVVGWEVVMEGTAVASWQQVQRRQGSMGLHWSLCCQRLQRGFRSVLVCTCVCLPQAPAGERHLLVQQPRRLPPPHAWCHTQRPSPAQLPRAHDALHWQAPQLHPAGCFAGLAGCQEAGLSSQRFAGSGTAVAQRHC